MSYRVVSNNRLFFKQLQVATDSWTLTNCKWSLVQRLKFNLSFSASHTISITYTHPFQSRNYKNKFVAYEITK